MRQLIETLLYFDLNNDKTRIRDNWLCYIDVFMIARHSYLLRQLGIRDTRRSHQTLSVIMFVNSKPVNHMGLNLI